jgi:hypothetical protein
MSSTNIDVSTAAGALTSPLWLDWLQYGLDTYVIAGGAILLTLRILIALREYTRKKSDE